MKKVLAALLSAVFAVTSMSIAGFAAVEETRYMEDLTGAPIDQDGKQYSSMGDTVTPNQTIYFLLPDEAGTVLGDSTNFRISVKKNQGSKLVKSVSVLEKRLTSGTGSYVVPVTDTTNAKVNTVTSANGRNKYIAVTLNDTNSTEEQKVDLTITFTAKKSPSSASAFTFKPGSRTLQGGAAFTTNRPGSFMKTPMIAISDKLALRTVFYVGNTEAAPGDATVSVGAAGKTIRPVANDYNEIIFETSSEEYARLMFTASSNPSKFLAKLSTKWTSATSKLFENNDAVIRSFSPVTIDAVSRATLSLVNPFEDVSPSRVYIYTVSSNGTLTNVTSQFTYNSDNDSFDTKTRNIGTYVLSVGKASASK